ncbi:MAG: RraA family protein [Lachnospiraceae bacterium]|nr:RraA family protein [Lachnospiraceae bacterium]
MYFNDRESIIELTPEWKGERLPDGRPKVADKYLDALYGMTLEEVWKPIFVLGYENQFVGGGEAPLIPLHDDGRKLVGRAVTCNYCPTRPDLHAEMFRRGAADGRKGNYNQWVIDNLIERDVVVCDMFDKIYKGTFLGGNLTTAIQKRTKNGGAVIWGGVRDVEQMKKVPDVQVYYRGIDPTPIRDFVMTGYNTVTNFGGAVCLPGDVVFGAGGGVLFIPSHLVADVVEGAAKTHVKDDFGFEMIGQGRFTTAQIDKNTWTEEMLDMLTEWIRTDPRGEAYRDLDWSKEYDLARNGDPNDTQTAL